MVYEFRLGSKWSMDAEMRQIQKERLRCVRFDEPQSFVGQAVGEVLSSGSIFETGELLAVLGKRRDVTERRPGFITRDVKIETLPSRLQTFTAKVPFADARRCVSLAVEQFCKGRFLQGKARNDRRPVQLLIGAVAATWEPIGEM